MLTAVAALWQVPRGRELLGALGEARLAPLLGATALFGVAILVVGLRWRVLLPVRGVSGVLLAAVAGVGQLLGLALPGPVGELAAAAMVQRRWGVPGPVALASSLHARVSGLVGGLLVALAMLAPGWLSLPEGGTAVLVAGGGGVALLVGALAVLALWPGLLLDRAMPRWLEALRGKAGVGRLVGTVWDLGFEFITSASKLGRGSGFGHLAALGWSVALHALIGLGIWLLALGIGAEADLAGVVFTQGAISAGAILLFVLPGQVVGVDAALIGLLVTAGGMDLGAAALVTGGSRMIQTLLLALGPAVLAARPAREQAG